MGDPTLGLITAFHYSAAHDSPENKAFLEGVRGGQRREARRAELHGGRRATTGCTSSTKSSKKLGGNIDGDKAMAAIKGMKWTSPRGPVSIDPTRATSCRPSTSARSRRRTASSANVEFDKVADVKDPGK